MNEDRSEDVKSDRLSYNKLKEIIASGIWKDPPKWTSTPVKDTKKLGFWDKIKEHYYDAKDFWVVRVRYEEYFASQLRARYIDLEGDFRTRPQTSDPSKLDENQEFIVELLYLAKGILERETLEKPDLLSASGLLDEAEECMVWLTPPEIKLAQINALIPSINKLDQEFGTKCTDIVNKCNVKLKNKESESCLASVEQLVKEINRRKLNSAINKGLQIERLRSLRFWGFILLVIYIFMFPVVSRYHVWPPYNTTVAYLNNLTIDNHLIHNQYHFFPVVSAWLVALSFCIIGAIGGFLSGLLRVRDTETNLELYEEAVLLFQIRPIFGAFSALVAFMLLSWGALAAFITPSPGTYSLVAFLSGFSERYFLKILKEAEPDDDQNKNAGVKNAQPPS